MKYSLEHFWFETISCCSLTVSWCFRWGRPWLCGCWALLGGQQCLDRQPSWLKILPQQLSHIIVSDITANTNIQTLHCFSVLQLKCRGWSLLIWSAGGHPRIVGKQRERNTVWRREAHSKTSPCWTHLLKSSQLLIRWEVSWGHNKTCNTNINLNIYKLQL